MDDIQGLRPVHTLRRRLRLRLIYIALFEAVYVMTVTMTSPYDVFNGYHMECSHEK